MGPPASVIDRPQPSRCGRLLGALAAGALVATAVAGSAKAHPHVFIDNAVAFTFTGGKVSAVQLEWAFDEIFSGDIIHDYDKNKDGKFDADEAARIEQEAFSNLKNYHYFTYVWVDGKPQHPTTAQSFKVRRHADTVVYSFVVPFNVPIDPRHARLEIAIYDESYYVEVALERRLPIRLEGEGSAGCQTKVTEDQTRPYYFDSVYPETISFECTPR
jgi:ABC-type uncharacterized transport system substrate-binding protein